MGIIRQGVLGGISGKIGNIVGASWKGINYLRIKPASLANPRTPLQVNQRNKFQAVLEFLQPNLGFLKVGFKYLANKQSAFNAAMSYTLNNAITGIAPNFSVDYAQALVSRGNLPGVLNGAANFSASGQIGFSWDDNTGGEAVATDRAMLLVYNPAKKESTYTVEGVGRSAEAETLAIPGSYAGDTVHVYMAFVSEDGTKVSNSAYLGTGVPA
ncbi:DUF6266 family protein [Salegentibacter sp. HM20]